MAQSSETPSRIVAEVNEAKLAVLRGNTHPLARPQYDRGAAPDGLAMDRMLLVLTRSPEQNAALEELLAEQQDPQSANYRRWLTPEEFGAQFGPSDRDVEQVTRWLSGHGFAVAGVSRGRGTIEFSGTAGQVREAFHTEIHKYAVPAGGDARPGLEVRTEEHWANASDPQIPAALAAVVGGVASLNDFGLKPLHRTLGPVVRNAGEAKVTPQFSLSYQGEELYGFGPTDWATQYNVTPLWNAGITGAGQTIAIVGQTDIKLTDIAAFRSAFGLPAKAPVIVTNGSDPGTNTDDEEESDLDVEWSGAVAKEATIKFVTSASTNASAGVELSALYIVDNKVATVASMSYGACEQGLGASGNVFFNQLWSQAAGEGITVFVSSGDTGSAGCDQNTGNTPEAAQYGLQVSGIASTPYNVAVGGTDLADYSFVTGENSFSTYWSSTNNATTGASLMKSVPETVWNDSCAVDSEAICNIASNSSFVTLVAGSGGESNCTTVDASTGNCSGGYAKPSWQKGAGVPADGKRDIPDVSLFSGDGARGSFYLICDTDATPDGACNYATEAVYLAVGGTSAAAPSMAGIQALINQKTGSGQGNINPTLYALAAKETLSGCNSAKGSGSACIFNDITTDTNAMPCYSGTPNCTVTSASDQYGILSGFAAGTGYDRASGLGSVNANNLVNNWPGVTGAAKVTLSATSLAFGSQTVGTASAGKTVTLTNSGTAALTGVAIALAGANPAEFVEANTCGASVAAAASCTITVEFKPAAAAAYAATVSIKDSASGSPQSVSLTGTGIAATPAVTLSATSVAFGSQTTGTLSAAKAVTLTNSGTAALTGIKIALAGTNPTDFVEATNCGASVAVKATCTITVEFKPAAAAAYAATVSITDNATGSPQKIALTGTGVAAAPKVTLSASGVAFGEQAEGTASALQTVTLTNSGTAALTGVAIAMAGANPADFVESSNCAATIAVNGSCVIQLKFKPAGAAAYAATVTVKDSAAGSPQTIALTGTGIVPAPKATLSATSEVFTGQAEGTESAAKTVTLTNSGTASLTGVAISLAGANPADFVETNNCAATIAAGASCAISIAFKPAAAATYTATVDVKDNATGSPQTIALTGTGGAGTVVGTIAVYAGELGVSGYTGNNGAATKATFYYAEGTAADAAGNLYIADEGNNVIRKVTASTGIITTVAGNGYGAGMVPGGYTGDGGPATSAELAGPFGVTVDKAGNLYIADTYNSAIRKVTAATGIITTVAGTGSSGYSGDGGLATQAQLDWPKSVAVDLAGNLYISDSSNYVIRKVTAATGKISTIAGQGAGCSQETDVFGDGCPAVDANFETSGYFTGTGGVAVDAKGNVYIADPDVATVREIVAATGTIVRVAGNNTAGFSGDGGPATSAELNLPRDVKVDGAGNLFIADDYNNVIREVTAATGKISTVAGEQYNGGGGKEAVPFVAPTGVKFAGPAYISLDPSGNLFLSDVNNFAIYKASGIAAATPVL